MKMLIAVIITATFFNSKMHAQERGCDAPPAEKIVYAKVFTSDSVEVPNQECTYFSQIHKLKLYYDTNSNEGTTKLNWVIELEQGDYLELDLSFGVHDMSFLDSTGFIRLKEGELISLDQSTYSLSSTSGTYQATGYRYVARINDEAKLAIESLWKPIFIQVKRKKKELNDQIDAQQLVSQLANSNSITINFDSKKEEEIYLYSAQGELVHRFSVANGTTYDLSNHPVGIYLLRANINGEVLVGKCVNF